MADAGRGIVLKIWIAHRDKTGSIKVVFKATKKETKKPGGCRDSVQDMDSFTKTSNVGVQ